MLHNLKESKVESRLRETLEFSSQQMKALIKRYASSFNFRQAPAMMVLYLRAVVFDTLAQIDDSSNRVVLDICVQGLRHHSAVLYLAQALLCDSSSSRTKWGRTSARPKQHLRYAIIGRTRRYLQQSPFEPNSSKSEWCNSKFSIDRSVSAIRSIDGQNARFITNTIVSALQSGIWFGLFRDAEEQIKCTGPRLCLQDRANIRREIDP